MSRADVLENARIAVDEDPVRLRLESADARYWRRWHKLMCLSPTLEVFEALLAGKRVPRSKLDQEMLKRYGG